MQSETLGGKAHRGLLELDDLGNSPERAQCWGIYVIANCNDWPTERLHAFLGALLGAFLLFRVATLLLITFACVLA